jgi:hypothetical protein
MKNNIYYKRLFSISVCIFMFLSLSAQNNCWQWDYTDESGVIVTLNSVSGNEIKKLYDNLDDTFVSLSVGDVVEFEFPDAMNFTGMLIYSGIETPVNVNNFQIHAKKETGSWENNKGKTANTSSDRGDGKCYTLADLTTAAGAAGYKSIRLECVNEPVTISEFQLFGFPNIANGNLAYPADLIRTLEATVTGKAHKGGDLFTRLYDGGRTTRTVWSGNSTWIECAFPEAITVKSYLISSSAFTTSAENYRRQFKNWTLMGSNTEGEEKVWETIDEVTNFIFPRANYTDMKFIVANPGSYKYYRIDATNNGATDETHISELQFYDTDVYAPQYPENTVAATLSKRYYKQQKVTFNRANQKYTPALLVEDFGNGSYFSDDRINASIVDGTYEVKFVTGNRVSNTGAAALLSIPKGTQYTMEYLIKYNDDFESGLHGKQFGFNLGVGYSGGSSEACRANGDGGSIRLQFDAHDDHLSNQLYAYYSDMQADTYGENPGNQKYDLQRGVWNKIRLTVTMETSYEAKDARIEVWCNDDKKIDVTGISLVRKDANRFITGICFESFPGGGGIDPTFDNYLYLDDMTWYPGNDAGGFTETPSDLYIKGSALTESLYPLPMKRILTDFPNSYDGNVATGNTFELITALKTGQYSFSTSKTGEDIIPPQSITVENTDGLDPVPHRIRVSYENGTPEVTVKKISEVSLFAPYNDYTIAQMEYTGNAAFGIKGVKYDSETWGDPRYRIRMTLEDESKATYGPLKGSAAAPNNDSNSSGYFELYSTTNEDDWTETINGTTYTGSEFKLSEKRRGEGYTLVPFNVKAFFNTTGSYYHLISDDDNEKPVSNTPASLFMRGTALAESTGPMVMKRINKDFPDSYNGNLVISNTYELITALQTGEYEFAVNPEEEPVISSQSIVVDNGGSSQLIPYRIRVNFNGANPLVTLSKVDEVTMWAPYKNYTIATFDYRGNSTFEASRIEYVKNDWGDERYRLRIYTEDGALTTYAYKQGSLTAPDDDDNANGYFDLYTTTNVNTWSETIDGVSYTGAEFKLSKKRRGENAPLAPFDMKIIFGVSGNYTHEISDNIPTSQEIVKSENGCSVYPALIDNSVTVASPEKNFAVEFISVSGVSLLKANSPGNTLILNNINLPAGLYLVRITTDAKVIAVKRVIKK